MEDWTSKIQQSDITNACKDAGFKTTQVYYSNYKRSKDQWSNSFIKVMKSLKKIVLKREEELQSL